MTNKVQLSQIDDLVLLLADGSSLLDAGASVIGEVLLVSGYAHITGYVYSDVASAASGMIIEQGLKIADFTDGTAATEGVTISTTAYTALDIANNAFSVQVVAPYARVIYINGAAPQTVFRLYFETRTLRGL